jgi:hypothetical protein
MGSFYSGRLLSSLLCHWLVGRAGRCDSLDVVHLLGAVLFYFFVEVDIEGGCEWFAVVVKLPSTGSVCVDWGTDRGRRVVR